MTKHRIFIAINLPEDIKKRLVFYQEKIEKLFGKGLIRWTKKDNLHITLEFLGYVTDEELLEICQNTKELAAKYRPFTITLNKICYPSLKKIPPNSPRMIWVVEDKVKEFGCSPHITLGRIKTWQWKQIEPEERPEVNQEINLSFEVNSIEIMESQLKRKGPEYTILQSIQFSE